MLDATYYRKDPFADIAVVMAACESKSFAARGE